MAVRAALASSSHRRRAPQRQDTLRAGGDAPGRRHGMRKSAARARTNASAAAAGVAAPSAASATASGAAPASARPPRFDRLDALRGVAIVWMAAFHFCFDLNYFHFIEQDFHRQLTWTLQRTCIVTL